MNNKVKAKKPILLCILDGWGISDLRENNAIAAASLPMGNSEVGHMDIGS
jgi:bisphosphoglycerate-independent phosphoglycerate mutase (AlkP superfamily)